MRMTLKELSNLAGVSPAYVSNILNGKSDEYKDETIARVKKIANEYNYRPDITNPYYPELAKGVENKAFELGYNFIYLNSEAIDFGQRVAAITVSRITGCSSAKTDNSAGTTEPTTAASTEDGKSLSVCFVVTGQLGD